MDALARARESLDGLSVGDAFGETHLFASLGLGVSEMEAIEQRILPDKTPWSWTDDTNMAASIVRVLRQQGEIDQDALARDFAARLDPSRGYGAGAWDLLSRVRMGIPWKAQAQSLFGGSGSYGNGAAMRAAPLGAYFRDDLEKCAAQAVLAAEITHANPEGIAGGVAVAVAAALAAHYRAAGERPSMTTFIDVVLEHIEPSEVRDGVVRVKDMAGAGAKQVAQEVGSGYRISAMDTVPFCLWCAGTWLDDYEEALWQTLSGLGDTDTTCAIVGGIVACYTGREGIPALWLERREPLPAWL